MSGVSLSSKETSSQFCAANSAKLVNLNREYRSLPGTGLDRFISRHEFFRCALQGKIWDCRKHRT